MEKSHVENEVVEKKEYLNNLVNELMEDEEWELPVECRFFLVADLEWTLLGM